MCMYVCSQNFNHHSLQYTPMDPKVYSFKILAFMSQNSFISQLLQIELLKLL